MPIKINVKHVLGSIAWIGTRFNHREVDSVFDKTSQHPIQFTLAIFELEHHGCFVRPAWAGLIKSQDDKPGSVIRRILNVFGQRGQAIKF